MSGVWTWTRDGEPEGQMRYRIADDAIELEYKITDDDGQGEDVRIGVPIWRRPCRDRVHLDNLLCQIQPDQCNLVHDFPSRSD
jgi:hypothetical protein